jgi:hypothetical protein
MLHGEKYNYEIVKINHRTGTHSIVDVVKGQSYASGRAEHLRSQLTKEEIEEGWSVYADRTTKAVWSSPPRRVQLKPSYNKSATR